MSPFREFDSSSPSQNIFRFLWNTKFHYRVYKKKTITPTCKPDHFIPPHMYFFKTRVSIALHLHPFLPNDFFLLLKFKYFPLL